MKVEIHSYSDMCYWQNISFYDFEYTINIIRFDINEHVIYSWLCSTKHIFFMSLNIRWIHLLRLDTWEYMIYS